MKFIMQNVARLNLHRMSFGKCIIIFLNLKYQIIQRRTDSRFIIYSSTIFKFVV